MNSLFLNILDVGKPSCYKHEGVSKIKLGADYTDLYLKFIPERV